MALDPIIPGAAWTVQLDYASGDAYTPSDHRTILVLDGPAATATTGTVRVSKVYDPAGGSDAGAVAVGTAVRFTLSPTDTTACDGHGGPWQVTVCVGAANAQYPLVALVSERVRVVVAPSGAVPHA